MRSKPSSRLLTFIIRVGVIATPTDRVLTAAPSRQDDPDVEIVEPEEPVKILETQGIFEDVVVWGHEILPASDDTFVKGVEEWVQFAETVSPFFSPVRSFD